MRDYMLSGTLGKRYLQLRDAVRAKKNIKEKKEACRVGKIAKPRDVLWRPCCVGAQHRTP